MKRTTIYISEDLEDKVKLMASDKQWSFTKMVIHLLEAAIREKERKKSSKDKIFQ